MIYIKHISYFQKSTTETSSYTSLVCKSSGNVSKIRIKLKSYDLNELKDTCEAISAIADETNAVLSGPTPLPMKKKVFCVLRSPHVNKDSREHFEIRTYSRILDVKTWSPETVDRLMAFEVPSGVDVKVKI